VSTRVINRLAARPHQQIAEALQTLIVSELLAPGRRLLLVSPWISDVALLDNRSGRFTRLNSNWSASTISLSAVIRALLERQTHVHIAYGTGEDKPDFIQRLEEGVRRDGTTRFLTVRRAPQLANQAIDHQKAFAGDDWVVHGSMNLTNRGILLNGELVTVSTELGYVSTFTTELMSLFA
jgi:phosphatidylserine/phosphatidylglycerophosphate/cardiolipin synthase-like enzyme